MECRWTAFLQILIWFLTIDCAYTTTESYSVQDCLAGTGDDFSVGYCCNDRQKHLCCYSLKEGYSEPHSYGIEDKRCSCDLSERDRQNCRSSSWTEKDSRRSKHYHFPCDMCVGEMWTKHYDKTCTFDGKLTDSICRSELPKIDEFNIYDTLTYCTLHYCGPRLRKMQGARGNITSSTVCLPHIVYESTVRYCPLYATNVDVFSEKRGVTAEDIGKCVLPPICKEGTKEVDRTLYMLPLVDGVVSSTYCEQLCPERSNTGEFDGKKCRVRPSCKEHENVPDPVFNKFFVPVCLPWCEGMDNYIRDIRYLQKPCNKRPICYNLPDIYSSENPYGDVECLEPRKVECSGSATSATHFCTPSRTTTTPKDSLRWTHKDSKTPKKNQTQNSTAPKDQLADETYLDPESAPSDGVIARLNQKRKDNEDAHKSIFWIILVNTIAVILLCLVLLSVLIYLIYDRCSRKALIAPPSPPLPIISPDESINTPDSYPSLARTQPVTPHGRSTVSLIEKSESINRLAKTQAATPRGNTTATNTTIDNSDKLGKRKPVGPRGKSTVVSVEKTVDKSASMHNTQPSTPPWEIEEVSAKEMKPVVVNNKALGKSESMKKGKIGRESSWIL